jgi:thiamine monophosphate kinase
VPNWIADDFSEIEDDEANEIFNQVLNSYSDYLTDFFVQIYQNGEDYKLVITHTKKYSESMVNDFKDTYMTILSNIINTDMSLDLSSTLK